MIINLVKQNGGNLARTVDNISSILEMILSCSEHMRELVDIKPGEMCLKTKKISLSFVHWSILNKLDFALSQNSLYKGDFVASKITIFSFLSSSSHK